MRLFCFPYAGGAASVFAAWPERLPWLEVRPVQLPGRATRRHEPPLTRIEDLVRAFVPELLRCLDRPFAFFGHSMGAVLAFETARYLCAKQLPLPAALYVSGRRPPQVPDEDEPEDDSDEGLLAKLRELNGTPPRVLENDELMQMILPVIRADFAMMRHYRYSPGPPLPCPITLFEGVDDEGRVPESAEGWGVHSLSPVVSATFAGDHFFLESSAEALLDTLDRSLRAVYESAASTRGFTVSSKKAGQ